MGGVIVSVIRNGWRNHFFKLLRRGRWGGCDSSGAGAGGIAFVAGFGGFVEIDYAPAAAFGAAAAGFFVVAVVEFYGVAEVFG